MRSDKPNAMPPGAAGSWQGYLGVILLEVVLTTVLYTMQRSVKVEPGLGYLYLLVITYAALTWTIRHAIFAVAASLAAYDICIAPPYGKVQLALNVDVRLVIFSIIGITLAFIVNRLVARADELRVQYRVQQTVTETLQRALLPRLQEIPGYDAAFLYEPASITSNVGGDFLDVTQQDGHTFSLLLGDVTGHGVEAAVQTAQLRYTLLAYAQLGHQPAECLRRLNQLVHSEATLSGYPTVFFGELDTNEHRMHYSSAAQPAMLWSERSRSVTHLTSSGMMLGVLHDETYKQAAMNLEPGDVLVLYTDGLSEARNGKEQYGLDRLGAALQQLSQEAAGTAVQKLFNGVNEFADCRLQDDVAVLWLRRTAG